MTGMNAIVLGMHRSGTSAVTRATSLLGLPLGRSGDVYAAPDNPNGHWESNSLCLANELILSQFHGSFTFPPRLRNGWEYSPKAEALILQLKALFFDVHQTDTWLWKDPRLALTLPIWRRILPDFCAILVIRNPRAVADSIHSRDGLPLPYCYALWDRYNRAAVAVIRGLPVVVVNFDAMEQDPQGECERLADGLVSLGVDVSGSRELAAESINSRSVPALDGVYRSSADLWERLQSLPRVSSQFNPPPIPRSPLWVDTAMRTARVWSLRSALAS
jgi:hypothetical protein